MNKDNINRERLIDNYILGRMDEVSRAEFEDMMKADSELKNDVVFMQAIKESLTRRERNLMRMMEMERELQRHACTTRPASVRPFKKIFAIAAACVLLFLGLSYPYSYYGLQDMGFWDDGMRGGLIDLHEYIETGQYEIALELIDEGISERTASIMSATDQSYVVSEINYLKWGKIQTLLKMKEFEYAYAEVEEFRKDTGYYQKKADKLYKRLKVRLRKH